MKRRRMRVAARIGAQVLLLAVAVFVFSLGLGIGLSQNQNVGMALWGVSALIVAFVVWWAIRSASSKSEEGGR